MKDTTNVKAEVTTFFQAVTHCSQTRHNKVIIQTDSLTLEKILTREWDFPWIIFDIVDQIWIVMERK